MKLYEEKTPHDKKKNICVYSHSNVSRSGGSVANRWKLLYTAALKLDPDF